MSVVTAKEEEARRLAAAGRWEEAAPLFEQAAKAASARRDRVGASTLWTLAGDALRRDDRPVRAALALRTGLDLLAARDPALASRRATLRAELAGVLVEAGEVEAAISLAREGLAAPIPPSTRTLLLDTLAGALLAGGRLEECAGIVVELEQVAPPAARPAIWFRRAALARLADQLDEADGLLSQVDAALARWPAAAAARAGARAERAEIALLRGDFDAAEAGFREAAEGFTQAGRRAGLFRAEGGLVRVAIGRSQLALGAALSGPIRYAEERGLTLLEAELRMSRGRARARACQSGAEEDLDRAVALAEGAGALLLEGRARAWRRASGFQRGAADLARTRLCLAPDRAWVQRYGGE